MHPQPGSGVDFHDDARLFFQRHADVGGHDVHAGNVQADYACRIDRPCRDLGMDPLGNVDRGAAGA